MNVKTKTIEIEYTVVKEKSYVYLSILSGVLFIVAFIVVLNNMPVTLIDIIFLILLLFGGAYTWFKASEFYKRDRYKTEFTNLNHTIPNVVKYKIKERQE